MAGNMKIGSINSGKERLEGVDFLRVAFDSFDVDKSGYLDPQELRAALTMLGVRGPDKSKSTMDVLMSADSDFEDADGDNTVSLKDLDKDGDEKVSFEEFKVFAALLPKRDHAIYRNALAAKPVTLPRDTSRATPVQIDQYNAQQKSKDALNAALAKLRRKLKLEDSKALLKDNKLLKKFQEVDHSGDGRVDMKELIKFMAQEGTADEVTSHEAWVLMNCADTNNDKHMTYDEFKKMMQTVARGVPMD